MKRFEFSLERLLKVKRQQERLAEMEQLRARQAAEEARARVRELQDQLARVAEQFSARVGQAMTPAQWSAAAEMSERLGRSIEESERVVAEADRRLEAAAQERAQLATEVEALTTLRRQQWDRWRQEAQQADQERLDELGLRRWMAARDDSAQAS